ESYLTDSAEKWFRANKSTIPDWSLFKIELVKAYKPSLHQLLLKMEQRMQLSNECVMDYYCDKIYLCSQVDPEMSFPMIIHYLTKGLKPSLIAHVIRRNPTTPNAFRVFAQDEEKILLTLNGFSYATTTEHYNYPIDNIDLDNQVNIIKRPINVNNQSFNRQHYQSAPQPLMNVPTTASSSSFNRADDPYRRSSSTSRQCYACHGFGHIAQYFDTGAAISLIHHQTLSTMQHTPIIPCSLKEVHTANCGFISLTGIVKLNVQIQHIHTQVDAYVTHDLICPMILGRDWIQHNYVNINFYTNRIYLFNGLASTALLLKLFRDPVIMSLSHDIVIPPFHTKFLYGHVPIKSLDDALFTPNVALQHTRMVLIPHSLLHIRNNRGVISVVNNTRHSKMIPRNTPLGFISSSTTPADINVISTSAMDSSHFSLPSLSLLSCTHCNVRFSTESALYNHLFHCCNKDLTSTTNTINSLVEHIDNPVKKMKVYIMLHRYSSLFDDSCLQGITCKPQSAINTGSHSPVAEHPRRVSHLNRQVINKEVQKMLHNRIIEPSNSPWAAPVVIVKKSDGSPRFCIDYRRLNTITQKDVYPLPRIDDVIERLNGSKIFSKLDLRSGYFQVPLAPDERPKTAFTTPDGLWEFTRLPQGLKNSPSVFQRLMHQTLGSLRFEICLAYLDDVVVFSPSFEQHLLDVTQVCQVLNESNFKLNYNKCAFFHSEIPFLGHKVTPDGCSPNDDNIRSIMQFPLPQSSKAAHSFLQMVGFYRKFIPRFAQISASLNKFTSKGFPFIWTEAEQLSFDQLKYALTSPMVLILPDPSRQYVIRTDASRVGVGAVLLQTQPSDPNDTSHTPIYKPVAFASRSLKKAEKNYSAIELEALAIWWSVTQKFRSYIEGQQFLLETDHKPLLSLMKKPYHNARIERWMTTLQQYDMLIQHISGKDNTTADALSRYPVDHPNLIDDDTALLHTSSTQTD
ncbi:unnamed protein product, partial [Adineta steineri]